MVYEACILHNGESLLSRNGNDSTQLLSWLLTQLENHACCNTSGVIKNLSNQHEPPRMYTAHNAHFD
ncbi:MAG: hypothetical protein K0R12_69 [Gammaproteobacteria bacterium]|jgi:hypothetical protein|nr:hypothetical protein [Gammaproteobacteria bacterium]